MVQEFISEAQAYCDARGIKLSTLGRYAVEDGTLFARLMRGGRCFPDTVDRVRAFMHENPPPAAAPEQDVA